jgi:hypothetical protein
MDELKKLAQERNRKHMAFIIKARDLSLKELYLMTTYGRKVEQLESGDMGVN